MFAKKIDCLFRLLGTDNTRLAAYAGCSESNFSRLRSGSRKPTPESSTVARLAAALYDCAADNYMTEALCTFVGGNSCEREPLCQAVISWLFSAETGGIDYDRIGSDPSAFGAKLDSVMQLAGLSNSRLARYTNVDPSYISRMRSGKRMPKNNPELMDKICEVLTARISELEKSSQLSDLIGCSAYTSTEEQTRRLSAWLYDRSDSADMIAVKKLISTISIADTAPAPGLPDYSEIADSSILDETADCYIGQEGIRRAVIRFLGNAVRQENAGLMLYSDHSMSWMMNDYLPVWQTLMRECLSSGVRMKVIHNIDRSTSEMISAISNWLPLYMSGLIEPYYCTLRPGERFGVTVFLNCGSSLIECITIKSCEENALYRYITESEQVALREKEFDELLASCRPLIRLRRGSIAPENVTAALEHNNIRISLTQNSVYVSKLTEPQLTFVFDHPLMLSAFQAYLNGSG